jgi:hypothetical protein
VSLVTVIYLILVRHYGRYESIPTISYHVFELNGPFGPRCLYLPLSCSVFLIIIVTYPYQLIMCLIGFSSYSL